MDEQRTEELTAQLVSTVRLEEYLEKCPSVEKTLPEYLSALLASVKLRRADVVRNCGLNSTVVYDIFAGKSRPGRDHALMLAFGLSCSLRDTQRLLRLSGNAGLWPKNRRDAIIMWCLIHNLSRAECDDELWRLGERCLLGS